MKKYIPMFNLIVLILMVILANACGSPVPTIPPKITLALINGVLIDGTGANPIPNAAVLIKDGMIAEVGPRDQISIPSDAQIIDVKGGTILPGFINAHVHRAFDSSNLRTWAQAGVTTVRDLGTLIEPQHSWNKWWKETTEGRDLPTPYPFPLAKAYSSVPSNARLVTAGPIVTVPNGYPTYAFDWGPDLAFNVTSQEDARKKIAWLLDNGADVIKIALLGEQGLSLEEAKAVVDVAHERGTIVTAHIQTIPDLETGLDAGINDAAHIVADYLSDEIIAQMVAQDLYIVPTLAVIEAYYGSLDSGTDNLRRFVAAGGKVALGDDYSNPGIELGMPIRDMELMEESGMTPMQIIVAATQNGAHVCNLGDQLGALEVGKIADVLVVDGDPLQDIHVLTKVQWVIKDGRLIRSPND